MGSRKGERAVTVDCSSKWSKILSLDWRLGHFQSTAVLNYMVHTSWVPERYPYILYRRQSLLIPFLCVCCGWFFTQSFLMQTSHFSCSVYSSVRWYKHWCSKMFLKWGNKTRINQLLAFINKQGYPRRKTCSPKKTIIGAHF